MKFLAYFTAIFLIAFFCFKFITFKKVVISTSPIKPTPTTWIHWIDQDKLFDLVQKWRVENGFKPYKESEVLCQIAEKRLKEVEVNYSHQGFRDPSTNCGKLYCELGENLNKDALDDQSTLNGWLNSPSHLKNLKYGYTHSCLKTDGNIAVQIFGKF